MIPFFFTRYRKAPLATFVSILASMCWLFAILFSVGYFLNWSDIKGESSLGESLAVAAVFAIIGFLLNKLANWLAIRKQRKLAEREAASQPAPTSPTRPATASEPTAPAGVRATPVEFCPKCGAKVEPGDNFCVKCGTKL